MYPPINAQKAYNLPGDYPVSEEIGERGLWLPSSIQLADEQIEYICTQVKQFYKS
jgi:perosamine synthetase